MSEKEKKDIEREIKLAKKGFLEYETEDELIESYGGGYISDETYYSCLYENILKNMRS